MTEMEQLEYEETISGLLCTVNQNSARSIALDMWKYYPTQTLMLVAALSQTQHTRPQARLLQPRS